MDVVLDSPTLGIEDANRDSPSVRKCGVMSRSASHKFQICWPRRFVCRRTILQIVRACCCESNT